MKSRLTGTHHTQNRSTLAALILALVFLVAWFALVSWFDKAYPLFTGEIIVDANAPGTYRAYLPTVFR